MKYILTVLAGVAIMSPAAYASDDLQSVDQIEKESAIMDFLGVVSSSLNSDYDRHRRPGRGRPGYPPPHRPGYPPPYRPPSRDFFVCYAENARGMRFVGRDSSPRWAEREAMNSCYRQSLRCFSLGCRRF